MSVSLERPRLGLREALACGDYLRRKTDPRIDDFIAWVAAQPLPPAKRSARADAKTHSRKPELARQLANWSARDGSGIAFDSSVGFILPNGAMRSPDAAWVRRSRLGGPRRA